MRLFFEALIGILLIILKYNIKISLNLWKKRKRYDIITLDYNRIPKSCFRARECGDLYSISRKVGFPMTKTTETVKKYTMPCIAMRDTVAFPEVPITLEVARQITKFCYLPCHLKRYRHFGKSNGIAHRDTRHGVFFYCFCCFCHGKSHLSGYTI